MKLVIDEPESAALERHLSDSPLLASSRIAVVEVTRATRLANPSPEVQDEVIRMLDSCLLLDLTSGLVRKAAELASASVRTLDAVHLASALRIEPDEVVVYDRRLARAATECGMVVVTPGGATFGS